MSNSLFEIDKVKVKPIKSPKSPKVFNSPKSSPKSQSLKIAEILYKKKQISPQAIVLSEDEVREHMGENSDEISALFPKVHPISGKTICQRGFYWDTEDTDSNTSTKRKTFFKTFKNQFWEIDQEYINTYDATGRYKIIIHSAELHKISTLLKEFDIVLHDKWLLAPAGYYWKYCSHKCNTHICCNHILEWYELIPMIINYKF
jgi:hypothetical protein